MAIRFIIPKCRVSGPASFKVLRASPRRCNPCPNGIHLTECTCTIDFSSHKKLVAAGRCRARGLKGCGNEGGGGRDSAGELLTLDLTIYWRLQFQGSATTIKARRDARNEA